MADLTYTKVDLNIFFKNNLVSNYDVLTTKLPYIVYYKLNKIQIKIITRWYVFNLIYLVNFYF